MRTLTLALVLLAFPAAAQTAQPTPPSHAHAPARKPRVTPVVLPGHPIVKAPLPVKPAPPSAIAPAPEAAAPPEPGKGTVTGQPLPRWAALRSDEVNVRAGPGTRYPIDWVYHRRDLPVRIEREFEVWRLVEDQDGIKGWVHQAVLVGRRGFAVKGTEPLTLRASAGEDGAPVAILKPGVVGRVRSCDAKAAWCEMQVADYRGWLKRDSVYGLDHDEAVTP